MRVCVFFLENSTADITEKLLVVLKWSPTVEDMTGLSLCSLTSLNLGLSWYQTGALSLSHQPSRQQRREDLVITHTYRVLKIFKIKEPLDLDFQKKSRIKWPLILGFWKFSKNKQVSLKKNPQSKVGYLTRYLIFEKHDSKSKPILYFLRTTRQGSIYPTLTHWFILWKENCTTLSSV